MGWPCVKAGFTRTTSASSRSRPTPAACEANSFVSVRSGCARIEALCDMRKNDSIMKKARMLATRRESCRILGKWGAWMSDVQEGGSFGEPGR